MQVLSHLANLEVDTASGALAGHTGVIDPLMLHLKFSLLQVGLLDGLHDLAVLRVPQLGQLAVGIEMLHPAERARRETVLR